MTLQLNPQKTRSDCMDFTTKAMANQKIRTSNADKNLAYDMH